MAERRVLSPKEIGELVPHWPDLDPRKIEGIRTRTVERIRLRLGDSGSHQTHDVLAVPAVITCPSSNGIGDFLLNGKHRSAIAIIGGYNLAAYHVRDLNDIENGLPKDAIGDMDKEQLAEFFFRRGVFEQFSINAGIKDMRTLVKKKISGATGERKSDLYNYLIGGGTKIQIND